ncbi:hypothetical protein B0H19DRAFT_1063025 [Mycena capillaripes]|nr:hypothetical protein B0H19DRAFT_1063025 [Mycena capillaripes]
MTVWNNQRLGNRTKFDDIKEWPSYRAQATHIYTVYFGNSHKALMNNNSPRRARNYPIRPSYAELGSDDFGIEDDAATTVGATSSLPDPHFRDDTNLPDNVSFLELHEEDFGESDDDADYGAGSRAPKMSNLEKTRAILEFMKTFNRFSLRIFLEELFTSQDGAIRNVTNSYLAQDGLFHLLDLVCTDRAPENTYFAMWIMSKATDICVKEVSRLTDTARKGEFYEDAKSLRLPSHSVKIELLCSFSVQKLLRLYDHATPYLQGLLKAIVGNKTADSEEDLVQRRQ